MYYSIITVGVIANEFFIKCVNLIAAFLAAVSTEMRILSAGFASIVIGTAHKLLMGGAKLWTAQCT